jgi:hypothetical protein
MSDTVIIIIVVAATLLILISMWLFNILNIRGKFLSTEIELKGEKLPQSKPIETLHRNVTTTIGGSAINSTIKVAGGDISSKTSTEIQKHSPSEGDVNLSIKKNTEKSDISTAGSHISEGD